SRPPASPRRRERPGQSPVPARQGGRASRERNVEMRSSGSPRLGSDDTAELWSGPVLHHQTRNSGHVIKVGGHQNRVAGERVSGDRGIEVFDATPFFFKRRFDAPEALA